MDKEVLAFGDTEIEKNIYFTAIKVLLKKM